MHNTSIPLSTPVHNTLFSEPLRTQTKSSFYTLSGFKCLICRYYENANDQWMEQKIFALSNWLHKVKSSLPTMTCLTKNICSFFLSLRLPLFLNQSLLQFEDSQWIFYVIFLFWLRTSSVVIMFYFSFFATLFFPILWWMSWYHWCSISFSSLLTIQHAEKFNLSTKIYSNFQIFKINCLQSLWVSYFLFNQS